MPEHARASSAAAPLCSVRRGLPRSAAARWLVRAGAALLAGPLLLLALVHCVDASFSDAQFLCDPTVGAEQCPTGQRCAADGRCHQLGACVPRTCAEAYPSCGPEVSDECGGLIDCPDACAPPATCGAAVPGRCGCYPFDAWVGAPGRVYTIDYGGLDASWQDVDAGLLHDGVAATTEPIPGGRDTDYFVFDHFDLDVPLDALILGVVVQVWRSGVASGTKGCTFHTQRIDLKWGDDQHPYTSMPMPVSDAWDSGADGGDGLGTYGAFNQTWSLDGGPPQVNQPEFGVRLNAECKAPADASTPSDYQASARIDYADLTVFYEPACP